MDMVGILRPSTQIQQKKIVTFFRRFQSTVLAAATRLARHGLQTPTSSEVKATPDSCRWLSLQDWPDPRFLAKKALDIPWPDDPCFIMRPCFPYVICSISDVADWPEHVRPILGENLSNQRCIHVQLVVVVLLLVLHAMKCQEFCRTCMPNDLKTSCPSSTS